MLPCILKIYGKINYERKENAHTEGRKMKEYKRNPKISPTIRRLIAIEALRYPRTPRSVLAAELIDKIRDLGEISSTQNTLERMISDARSHEPPVQSNWHLGLWAKYDMPPVVIPRLFEIQKKIKEVAELSELPKIPTAVALWIGQLHAVVKDPLKLYLVAWAYASHQYVGMVARPATVAEDVPVDTSELDTLLANGDFGALTALAVGFKSIMNKPDAEMNGYLTDIMARVKDAVKNNPMEGSHERTHSQKRQG